MFEDGNFETIYLAPSNYHRIHMPTAGTLRRIIYIPGKYYSVNPDYVERIEGLFTKNERAVALFDTPAGPMALVFVGATIVGSIGITGVGIISPNRERRIQVTDFPDDTAPSYAKGQEIGFFKLGSTVITIFGKNSVTLSPEQKSGSPVKMGSLMGYISESGDADTSSEDAGTAADSSADTAGSTADRKAPEQNSQNDSEEATAHEDNPDTDTEPAPEEGRTETAAAPDTEESENPEASSDADILKDAEPAATASYDTKEATRDSGSEDSSGSSESPEPGEHDRAPASGKRETQKRTRKAKSSRKK